MNPTEEFIMQHEGTQQDILLYLHNMIINHPGITTKISYKLPFYYRKSWLCYLNPVKKDGVELAFTRGRELSNEQGLLDFNDRKLVASITIYSLKDIPENTIREILQEAILLDEQVPYSIRKKK